MDYNQSGFNDFLTREQTVTLNSQLDPLQSFNLTDSLSGDKIDSEMEGVFVGPGINANNITTGFMKFDRAKGGELILGGQNNQNGTFSLKDQDNQERISMTKDGITVSDGSIIIKNENNQTIVDSQGINSVNNFNFGYDWGGSLNTVSSSFLTAKSFNFSLDRESNVHISISIGGSNNTNLSSPATPDYLVVTLYIDGSQVVDAQLSPLILSGIHIPIAGPGSYITRQYADRQWLKKLSKGFHTIELKYCSLNGGQANLDFWSMFYLILGK